MMRTLQRLAVPAVLVLVMTPSAATTAWSHADTLPPAEVLEFFDEEAAAAFTTDGAAPTEISFGTPRTVHQFTHAYTRGDTRGDILEPDGTWIAPAFEGDGRSVGTALVWYPPGQDDPEVAVVEWDPQLGERLAAAPADPVVRFAEANLWFTLGDDELRGLDGSQVSVAEYGQSLATHFAEVDAQGDPESDQVGGAQVLVPDSAILRPRGIATVLAIGAAVVLAAALLRRLSRGAHRSADPGDTST